MSMKEQKSWPVKISLDTQVEAESQQEAERRAKEYFENNVQRESSTLGLRIEKATTSTSGGSSSSR